MRPRGFLLLATASLAAVLPGPAGGSVKPGLEGAQELFRKNHWAEARTHLRSQWGSLAEKDRAAATFLIGRSYVREAEFYGEVRRVGLEVGLAYLEELASVKTNQGVAWIPLFTGLYQLEAGKNREAERSLLAAGGRASLPTEWKATARLARAMALHRLGRAQEAAALALLKDPGPEARFLRLLATGIAEPPTIPAKGRRDRLMAAAVLFRAGRPADAEVLLGTLDLDQPDVEEKPDPRKTLRFHDPLLATAWERVCWERAIASLKPLAAGTPGVERSLAAYYVGVSLFRLGALDEASKTLAAANDSFLGAELQPTARLLIAASGWKGNPPTATELGSVWTGTQTQPETVLAWDDVVGIELPKSSPLAGQFDRRLRALLSATERPSGSLVGRWGLVRLRHGDDPGAVIEVLGEHRDDSNKNKLEWNDPLLLLALCAGNYRDQEYPQSLETLFEMSKTLPGLRALQWNLQGVYAARQKAGGEARIGQ